MRGRNPSAFTSRSRAVHSDSISTTPTSRVARVAQATLMRVLHASLRLACVGVLVCRATRFKQLEYLPASSDESQNSCPNNRRLDVPPHTSSHPPARKGISSPVHWYISLLPLRNLDVTDFLVDAPIVSKLVKCRKGRSSLFASGGVPLGSVRTQMSREKTQTMRACL
jgi:hypothetical protein